jgi:Fic family protein
LDPEKMAFDVLINFLKIHPFVDGNFRIARLLMNIVLIQKNYSPVLINCDRNSKEGLEFANMVEQMLLNDNRDIGYLYIKNALGESKKREEQEKRNKIENNIIDAYNFIETLVDKSNKDITLDDIKKIHWHIYKGIDDSIAGKFRDFNYTRNPSEENAGIKKLRHQDYKNIPKQMDEFIDWLNKTDDDIVKIAGDVLIKLFEIHPFVDGNGRVARAVMNLVLIQNDYPPAVIDCAHYTAGREEYINALREIQINNRPENYYAYISNCIEKGKTQEEKLKVI